jgi:hypothetical protein
MPVDQSGENILFVQVAGHVEAHVQIQYTGDPQRFAWLVPVPLVPEVSVGSQQLFTNLLNATVPTFALSRSFDTCGGGRVTSPGCGFGAATSGSASSFDGVGSDGGVARSDAPPVTSHEAVGAFDVTVLSPKTADEITSWLATNSFLQSPDAPAILQDYIDRGHVFVAVKLLPGAGVNEIHPLVIRYEGTEPCIPLKLTAVAATMDMGVRAFFLGDRRVAPTTYREVTLDPARLDFLGLGDNYDTVVSSAVDEPGADGHAFVTEYAGASTVVGSAGIFSASWNADAFRRAEPENVVEILEAQGLVRCSTTGCTTSQPLVLPMVRKYLPAPASTKESDFYSCVSCNAARIDRAAWDGAAFAEELEERVIAPGRHASELLQGAPYLTRLFTRISPDEMTADPEFTTLSPSAANVTSSYTATQNLTCGGDQALEIPGRPAVALEGASLPSFTKSLPFALTVAEYNPEGVRTVLFDNTKDVDKSIRGWNDSQGYPHPSRLDASGSASGGFCALGSGAATPTGVIGSTVLLTFLRRLRRRRPQAGDSARI